MFQSNDFKLNGVILRGLARECKNDFCFVAGTLVHTDKGLVPIEQLKVGDRVLSKHESGQGEQAYKAITRTFKSETKQPITVVPFFVDSIVDHFYNYKTNPQFAHKFGSNLITGSNHLRDNRYLFCTVDHPFWVIGKGWVAAGQLDCGDRFVTMDGDTASYGGYAGAYEPSTPLMQATDMPEVAVYLSHHLDMSSNNIGSLLVDFRAGYAQLVSSEKLMFNNSSYDFHPNENILELVGDYDDPTVDKYRSMWLPWEPASPECPAYRAYVYNIEVEDYHTYFVGEDGLWVHNADCFEPIKGKRKLVTTPFKTLYHRRMG